MIDDKRALLRHTGATIANRGGKTLRGAPASFAAFRANESTRTPAAIVAHMGDLFDWALSIAKGAQAWRDSTPLAWDAAGARFFDTLKRFDDYLQSDAPLAVSAERLFQGPIADALTHVGQLAMLRRLAASAVKGEDYYVADIAAGRVGLEQSPPKREF